MKISGNTEKTVRVKIEFDLDHDEALVLMSAVGQLSGADVWENISNLYHVATPDRHKIDVTLSELYNSIKDILEIDFQL